MYRRQQGLINEKLTIRYNRSDFFKLEYVFDWLVEAIIWQRKSMYCYIDGLTEELVAL